MSGCGVDGSMGSSITGERCRVSSMGRGSISVLRLIDNDWVGVEDDISWLLAFSSRFVSLDLSSVTVLIGDVLYYSFNTVEIFVSVAALYSSVSVSAFLAEGDGTVIIVGFISEIIGLRWVMLFLSVTTSWCSIVLGERHSSKSCNKDNLCDHVISVVELFPTH
ncbi:hypothetical protein X975_02981, partial [Stegodyphus mimosarum]